MNYNNIFNEVYYINGMFNKEFKHIDYKTFTVTFSDGYKIMEERGFFETLKYNIKKLILCEWF
jgi:hypothetical protein